MESHIAKASTQTPQEVLGLTPAPGKGVVTIQSNITKRVWLQISESPRIELPVRRVLDTSKKKTIIVIAVKKAFHKKCHSKLDLESSTLVVVVAKRRAWKTLKRVQGDTIIIKEKSIYAKRK